MDRALALISAKDEVARVKEDRARVLERLRRLRDLPMLMDCFLTLNTIAKSTR